MKKILGGREKGCDYCRGTVVHLQVKNFGVVTQCKDCGALTKGRVKDKIHVYSEEM